MPLPIPPAASAPAFAPIARLLQDRLVAPRLLAERWGYTDDHLSNLRRARHGIPWIRLPLGPKGSKGGIRYRLSDIVIAELEGSFGPVNMERVHLAIASCPALTDAQRAEVIAHLSEVLRE